MAELRQPDYNQVDPEVQAVIDRWAAELEGDPEATLHVFQYLYAMAAGRLGIVREMKRLVRDGRPVVILVSEEAERFYQVQDPQLGEHETAAVDGMLAALGVQ